MNPAVVRPEFLLLGFVLIFSPLAFGTVEPWSLAIAESAALLGLAIALRRRTRKGRLHLHAAPGTLPLLLFLGFMLLQATPLPPGLVRHLSPAAHARWAAALDGAGPLPWLTLSLDPLATVREFFRLCACAAVYLLTVQLLASRERLRAATGALAMFTALLSFAAILQFIVAPRLLLFVRPAPWVFPFGPFVNRNHYANLMAMLTPVLLGLLFGQGSGRRPRTMRGRLVELLARPDSGVRILLGFAALLAAASLVISLSRGATVAVAVALLLFGCCLVAFGIGRRRIIATAVFCCALAVFIGWFGWGKVAARFAALGMNPDIVDAVRAGIWRDTIRICADFPLFGAGVGSFSNLYPSYRAIPGSFAVAHAHNDYLEMLAGGGAVGFGLGVWFAGAVLLAAAGACARSQDRPAIYLACGSIAGCVAFLVHGASDFSLAIGANALYFFFILGLAVSAARAFGQRTEAQSVLGERRLPAVVSHLSAALAIVAIFVHGAELTAIRAWTLAERGLQRPEMERIASAGTATLLARAAFVQPLDPRYPAALARIAMQRGNIDEAILLTRRALRLLPINAASLMQLGTLLASSGSTGEARRFLETAVAADPSLAAHRERFGAWLLSRGELDASLPHLRAAMSLEPERAPGIFGMLVLAGFDDRRIAAVVPPDPAVLVRFARYAAATGARRLAGETYARVLAIDHGNREAAAGLRAAADPR